MEELPKIPFAENLADLLASERSESRRDPDKLCDLVSIIAWARRFQKPKEKWAEADWADLYIALQLGLDAITETISDLDVKEQQIFSCVKEGMPLIKGGKETKTRDVTSRYVADQTGIPYKTCYRLLEKMVEKGFLNKDKRKGKNVYSVFREKEPKEFLIGVDISQNSPDKLLEQVLSFLGDFSPSHGGEKGGYSLIDPLTGDRLTVEFNDGKPTVKAELCSIFYPEFKMNDALNDVGSIEPTCKPVNIESASLPPSQGGEKVRSAERGMKKVSDLENKPLNLISQLMRKDLLFNSERISKNKPEEFKPLNGLLVCELCAKQGEAMFFASQHDLNVHIKSWHCGR
jgi:predicted transcriptional regulator